jgi:peptidoglycan/LPS O-acetylase OafA/YrhL
MVRPMLVTAFAAAPMLLVYAWLQPIVPETRVTAIILTIALAAGAVVTVRGKLVGAFVLVLAGLGLLVQSAVTLAHAPDAQRGIAGYYLVFWLPAAVCAIVCGVRLAGPTWRLLRGR